MSEISRSTVIPQAQKLGQTVLQSHGSHKVAEQYRRLAAEIEKRLERFDSEAQAIHPNVLMAANG